MRIRIFCSFLLLFFASFCVLAKSASVNTLNQFFEIVRLGDEVSARNMLFSDGSLLVKKNTYGTTALMLSALLPKENMLKMLLASGARIDAEDEFGETALFYAMNASQDKNVLLLIQQKASLQKRNDFSQTPLKLAVRQGKISWVSWISKERRSRISPQDLKETRVFLQKKIQNSREDEALIFSKMLSLLKRK